MSHPSLMPLLFPGDLITVRGKEDGTVYRVTKVNPKNLKLEDQEGRTFTLNALAAVKAPEGTVFEAVVKELPSVTLGTVVTFKNEMAFRAPGKYVCVGLLPDNRAKFAQRNGDAGRYWKSALTNVEISSAE